MRMASNWPCGHSPSSPCGGILDDKEDASIRSGFGSNQTYGFKGKKGAGVYTLRIFCNYGGPLLLYHL